MWPLYLQMKKALYIYCCFHELPILTFDEASPYFPVLPGIRPENFADAPQASGKVALEKDQVPYFQLP